MLYLPGQTSPGQLKSGNNLMLVEVLHWAHILQVNTCPLLKIFLYTHRVWSNTLLHFLYNLAELVEKFQSAFYGHYESGGQSLYKSNDMQALCETRTPHLFHIFISTIVNDDGHATSERHSYLQQQRIVVLLHMLPYFRYLLQITMYLAFFTIQRIKNYSILYNFKNFHVSFILTVSAVTGNKQPLFLSIRQE